MNLSQLKEAPYNPRTIDEPSLNGLKYSLEEFGDISGIVFNKRTGNLVAGHQRRKGLLDKFGDLNISMINNEYGFIETPDGSKHSVRFVDWDIKKEKAANLAANNPKIQGEFTPDVRLQIDEIKLDLPELSNSLRFDEINVPVLLNDGMVDYVNSKDEWIGLPKYEDGEESFRLIIHFDTEEERIEFLKLLKVESVTGKNKKTLSMRWPIREKNDLTSLKFV